MLAPVPRGARRLNWRRSTESCLRVWNPNIDLQISVVVVRVHASRHLPPWLKEATVDACGGGTVSRWK